MLLASPAFAQHYEKIAKQIVNASAGVKPGDAVIISGGVHTLPLMEAVAVEVARAGGQPNMWISTDKTVRAVNMETPEAAIQANKFSNMSLQADVLISLPSVEDSRAVMAGMTPARGAKFSQAAAASGYAQELDASKLRGVSVSYPSKSLAAAQQLDYASHEQMIWSSIGADCSSIAMQADKIKQLLATGKKCTLPRQPAQT
ncbi:aminopeptidase [Hymenobacter sp. BT491]|uniref:aminopeptidase n=1 Tax=Hymenobacter sp. BT491 TaxID=2766779 RepID=UPI0021CC8493|nr:aminopeptidase [Hymenobacter sp. BT491]